MKYVSTFGELISDSVSKDVSVFNTVIGGVEDTQLNQLLNQAWQEYLQSVVLDPLHGWGCCSGFVSFSTRRL